jgi:hypothetical protein
LGATDQFIAKPHQLEDGKMDTINRSVALVKPKQPFLEWLNALPDNEELFTLTDLQTDCTVLLLPEFGNDLQAQKFIKKIHAEIFERELDSFCTDPVGFLLY